MRSSVNRVSALFWVKNLFDESQLGDNLINPQTEPRVVLSYENELSKEKVLDVGR